MAPPIKCPCGTRSAYVRHKRKGEQPCDACRLAYNEYWRSWYQRSRSGQRAQTATTPSLDQSVSL